MGREYIMSQIELNNIEKNKELVLEAFDTLFNQRDYIAAEHYWSLISRLPTKGFTSIKYLAMTI
jgi:hypothetical protein